MIGVDWGTSSLRAWRLRGETVLERRAGAGGILQVPPGGFPAALQALAGDWIAAGEDRVLVCGMAGSRQGWLEAPYLPCPAGPAELAGALAAVPFAGASVRLVPGVSGTDAGGMPGLGGTDSGGATGVPGVPEVMRGEETQLAGARLADGSALVDGLVCLPGSHSKWARLEGGRIAGFTTSMTGEAYAALRHHTILGRLMAEADPPDDLDAFDRGVARAGEPGGLLHHLFGVRTLGLAGQLGTEAAASYLSGLLIGHELAHALPPAATVHLIGAAPLCALYARAAGARGARPVRLAEDAAAIGLARIAGLARWG